MTIISRILPMPLHSLMLIIVWLMINSTFSVGHLILGTVLGVVIPLLCAPLRVPQPTIAKPFKFIGYTFLILKDIVLANIEVALLVVGPMRKINPGFIAVPLDLTDTFPITVLASTVTMTPGTVSAEISRDKKWLYVHVLSMPEEESTLIASIKSRYESRIKEMFEC